MTNGSLQRWATVAANAAAPSLSGVQQHQHRVPVVAGGDAAHRTNAPSTSSARAGAQRGRVIASSSEILLNPFRAGSRPAHLGTAPAPSRRRNSSGQLPATGEERNTRTTPRSVGTRSVSTLRTVVLRFVTTAGGDGVTPCHP